MTSPRPSTTTTHEARSLLNIFFPIEITLSILDLAGFWVRERVVSENREHSPPKWVSFAITNAPMIRAIEYRSYARMLHVSMAWFVRVPFLTCMCVDRTRIN